MDYCTNYLSTHNFNFSKFMQIEVLANFLLWRVQLHGQLNFIIATVEAIQAAKIMYESIGKTVIFIHGLAMRSKKNKRLSADQHDITL